MRGIHRGPVNSPHKWSVTSIAIASTDALMKYPDMSTKIKEKTFYFISVVHTHPPFLYIWKGLYRYKIISRYHFNLLVLSIRGFKRVLFFLYHYWIAVETCKIIFTLGVLNHFDETFYHISALRLRRWLEPSSWKTRIRLFRMAKHGVDLAPWNYFGLRKNLNQILNSNLSTSMNGVEGHFYA